MKSPAALPSRIRCGVGSFDGFHSAMAIVDVRGWDGPTAREVLEYARVEVVAPAVRARRLSGSAREDALAVGWASAWRALTAQPVRTAASPWGVVRVAVERGLGNSYIADRYGMSATTGWARRAEGVAPSVVITPGSAALENIAEDGTDSSFALGTGTRLGERLQWIHEMLSCGRVGAGTRRRRIGLGCVELHGFGRWAAK